jgi:hypothetical protein
LSSCAAILIGGFWKRFFKGPSFHTDFWAFFVCAQRFSSMLRSDEGGMELSLRVTGSNLSWIFDWRSFHVDK